MIFVNEGAFPLLIFGWILRDGRGEDMYLGSKSRIEITRPYRCFKSFNNYTLVINSSQFFIDSVDEPYVFLRADKKRYTHFSLTDTSGVIIRDLSASAFKRALEWERKYLRLRANPFSVNQ